MRFLAIAFSLGVCLGASGMILYKANDRNKRCEKSEFVFMRMYGHLQENSWERLDDSYPDIEEADVFRLLIKKGDYFEVIVPMALPVTWEGNTFVYKGIWPVKNK